MKIRINENEYVVDENLSAYDAAKAAGLTLSRDIIAVDVNGETRDLTVKVKEGDDVKLLTFNDEGGKRTFFHTASHILAQAVKRLYPKTKLTIGPSISDGFYYDMDSDMPFTQVELDAIEAEMKKIVKENLRIERFTLPRDEAIKFMEEREEPYKVLLIGRIEDDEEISFYKQGEFVDLCAGPHLFATGLVKAFKLTQCTGAYWEGNSKNKMLQRIYGVAFPTKDQLDEYLARIEEAKKRDHRKLGKELGLFTIMDEGPGFPFFLPNGMILRNTLIDYWRLVHHSNGYDEISTPIILNRTLWERSGHWDHYKNNMYTTVIDDQDFAIKPMNCPGSILVYKNEKHSYKDLPLRYAELGLVHRHELSGALQGLMRVRCFTQDDAHIFLRKSQIKEEIKRVVTIISLFYKKFGFKYTIELSTMPEDHIGTLEDWEIATNGLKDALNELNLPFEINEGDGAFYGPKIDFHLEDCLGRTWQCGTIQLDYQLPERFELEYTTENDTKERPVMIHRVVFGSVERFIGILTEHFAGAFPLWISPVQVQVLPISENYNDYAVKVQKALQDKGLRVNIDNRSEKIGYKIREAQLKKIPYMLIVGEKEVASETVSVRSRDKGDLGSVELASFVEKAAQENNDRV